MIGLLPVNAQYSFRENRGRNKIDTNSAPDPGKGNVYLLRVKRKGMSDAIYIGATRRPISIRYKEHLREAQKLGTLSKPGQSAGYQSEVGYNEKTNLARALIRTSIGITKTRSDRAEKYASIEAIGQYSLVGLPAAEKFFITSKGGYRNQNAPNLINYASLKNYTSMNRSAGGEGLDLGMVDIKMKLLSAFYHLRDELQMPFDDELELLYHITNLAYKARVPKKWEDTRIKNAQKFLVVYFSVKPSVIATIKNNNFSSFSKMNAFINSAFVTKKRAQDKVDIEQAYSQILIKETSLVNFYNSWRQESDFKSTDDVIASVKGRVAKDIGDQMVARAIKIINEVFPQKK